jgi:type II secretion system (T2SS) protein M
MMPAWFQRMNQRERVLLLMIAAVVFLLINYALWSWLLGSLNRTRADLAANKAARLEQSIFLKERSMWEHRDDWLKKHQPALKSPVEASTLLDQVKQIASKHNIVLENPQIGSGDSTPNYQAVFASVETKSPWPPLVHFLYEVQQPEAFVVFENVSLAIDSADPTVMRGKFKIARWFSPKQGQAR